MLGRGYLDEVIGELKSGKEATVYLGRTRVGLAAVKVYRDLAVRSFKNDARYRVGRYIGDARVEKAIAQRSAFGRRAQGRLWAAHEYAVLWRLWAAGVPVPEPLVAYASVEVHSCHQRSAELLGLGAHALRLIPTDGEYRIDLAALHLAIAEDRAAGRKPFMVIGNAGTINTGAIDDLDAIADLCAEEGLRFHVDGAIGAMIGLAPALAPLLRGIERADSIALDLHKWMHVPFEAGLVLVRDAAAQRATFETSPAYLAHAPRGLAGGATWLTDFGLETSRDFKALKVWLSWMDRGVDAYGRMMQRNVDQAHHLAARVEREPLLELMAPVGLDIVCFRVHPEGWSEERLDALNRELLMRVHESGVAVPSYTTLGGRYCLRVAIGNHRSTFADFDVFVDALLAMVGEVEA